jgi:hypothetical protein
MANEAIISKTYELVKYATPFFNRVPRNFKFTFSDRVINLLADLLERIIEAYYAPRQERKVLLQKVNIKIEIIRHFFRLGFEWGLYSSTQLKEFSTRLDEIGRMTGGWIKSLR